MTNNNVETSRLVSIEEGRLPNRQQQQQNKLPRWMLVSLMLSMTVLVTMTIHLSQGVNDTNLQGLLLNEQLVAVTEKENKKHGEPKKRDGRVCMFCELNQEQPLLHEDQNFLHSFDKGEDAIVTPMTFTYNYELYDGQSIFTDPTKEGVPNLDFDYAILSLNGVRHINLETGELVSLDEVYFHHLIFHPVQMIGAEALTVSPEKPGVKFPNGYGMHVIYDQEKPMIHINAHLLSNKNLKPIEGSAALAHKQCNECYYGPNKGLECTPEVSGTFKCCGDSTSCLTATSDDYCHCTTNNKGSSNKITKYQIQVDMNISRDIDKFKRVDIWTLLAPACQVNQKGVSVFEKVTPDNFCYNNTSNFFGGGSAFHKIDLQNDDNPLGLVETKVNVIAPASGLIVFGLGHLHTGGVSATLRINGKVVCTTGTTYGTNNDEKANARNERNHLIGIDTCYDTAIYKDGGIRFQEGDVMTAESIYNGSRNDDRFIGHGAAGEHKNVMSFFTMGVIFDGDSDWLTEKRNSASLSNNFDPIAGLK